MKMTLTRNSLSQFPSLTASSVWGLCYSKAEIFADRLITFQTCIVSITLPRVPVCFPMCYIN